MVPFERPEAVTPASPTHTVTPLAGNRFHVTGPSGSRLVYAVTDGRRTWLFLEGRAYIIEPAQRGSGDPALHTDDSGMLASPMPATVIDVRVSAGDRVSRGDVLVTVEAMKMELPILAPRDAVVTSVRCDRGDLVQAGAPLVELG